MERPTPITLNFAYQWLLDLRLELDYGASNETTNDLKYRVCFAINGIRGLMYYSNNNEIVKFEAKDALFKIANDCQKAIPGYYEPKTIPWPDQY